jgi:hypothetical protein
MNPPFHPDRYQRILNDLIVCHAGEIVDRRRGTFSSEEALSISTTTDRAIISHVAGVIANGGDPADLVEATRERARELVWDIHVWADIERLAAALARQPRMSGDEVLAVLGGR